MLYGNHVFGTIQIGEYDKWNRQSLTSSLLMKRLMLSICEEFNLTVVAIAEHDFPSRKDEEGFPIPSGCSVVLALAESHFSVHTWPEDGILTFDIYTCNGSSPSAAANEFKKRLSGTFLTFQEYMR